MSCALLFIQKALKLKSQKKKKKKTLKLKANEHSISWKLCKAITCKQYTC